MVSVTLNERKRPNIKSKSVWFVVCLVEIERPFMFQIFLENIQIQMVNKEMHPLFDSKRVHTA